jgi:hypothetical protein
MFFLQFLKNTMNVKSNRNASPDIPYTLPLAIRQFSLAPQSSKSPVSVPLLLLLRFPLSLKLLALSSQKTPLFALSLLFPDFTAEAAVPSITLLPVRLHDA